MFEAHFQTFDDHAARQGAERVTALRAELQRRGVDGFIVPRADEQQNEYVPAAAERLAWLTGFSGSAGLAIVLADTAAIFVDGRYTLQLRDQVDTEIFTAIPLETSPDSWIETHVKAGQKLAYDPWLHTPATVARFERAAKAAGAALVALDTNPIDAVWHDQPAPPHGLVSIHSERFAGEAATSKIARVQAALAKARCGALVVSDAHSVAWLFNIRGADVAHTPLPLAFAVVEREGRPKLVIEPRKLSASIYEAVAACAEIVERPRLAAEVETLGAAGLTVRFDSATVPAKLVTVLQAAGGTADVGSDPIALMKAAKNATELAGARAAHLRDGAAMTRFLAWLDTAVDDGKPTEIDAAAALESFRRDTGELAEISFPTIAGAGPNAALPHYRVTRASNRRIREGIFLVDSGAQYRDGTTDITRTIAVGKPTREMRDRFTRVLKGHIAIARAVFPKGTSGAQIDALARIALWDAGLDFDHGTGHGVGSYLSVHEGPQRISKLGTVELEPGMILSNEPGYYKAGAWGIRIENLIVVEKRDIEGAEREMLGFKTISLAPIDIRLVEPDLMSQGEIAWLDAYHERVRHAVSPLVEGSVRKWLRKATKAVG